MKALSIFLTSVILIALSACKNSGTNAGTIRSNTLNGVADTKAAQSDGELLRQYKKIYAKQNEPYFDACDFENRDKIFEVVRALDQRNSELQSFAKVEPASATTQYKKLGSYEFEIEAATASSDDKWSTLTRGWRPLLKEFDEIKSSPMNMRWVELDGDVRSLIGDEEMRLVHGTFMGLTRTSGSMLMSIRENIYKCLDDDTCSTPGFSEEQRRLLSHSGSFRLFLSAMDSKKISADEKRESMFLFSETLTMYASRFELVRAAGSRIESNTLVIPLNTTALGESASEIITWIEKGWNVDGTHSIKIEPTKDSKKAYRVLMGPSGGGRSYVNHQERVIQLYDRIRLSTLVHEFGHILGFRDYYYTTWSKASCSYHIEFNSGDMMSDSTTGAVRDSHWKLLKKTYWPSSLSEKSL